jgi:predicted nucleic acid-binding Zn ribbon protein
MSIEPMAEVKFCYQCGRRIDASKGQCWYCGSRVRRSIRPLRHCHYCGSEVPGAAVKCSHCGEFLDGREKKPDKPPDQMIYVVDKSLLQSGQDRKLLPGRAVPPDVARSLEHRTVMAIEANQPHLIEQPGISFVQPSGQFQGDPDILDVEAEAHTLSGSSRMLPSPEDSTQKQAVGGRGELVPLKGRSQSSSNLPMRRDETPQAVGMRLGLKLGHALASFSKWLLKSMSQDRPVENEVIDAALEDRYRVCESCTEEILTADNFCFHCGTQYHAGPAEGAKRRATTNYPSNAPLFFLLALVSGTHLFVAMEERIPVEPAYLAGASVVLGVWAFLRRRTSLSQLFSILFVVLNIVIFLGFMILGDG